MGWRRWLLAGLAVGTWAIGGSKASAGQPVGLVVVVVIDQFRGDYLDSHADHFVDGGFLRLMRAGAWFTDAQYEYGPTATGPGHASLLTGAPPAVHGIVGNNWTAMEEKAYGVYCCGDDSVETLTCAGAKSKAGRSPVQLRAETLGDALKRATGGQARVWGVALKDRAAILMSGRSADGAIWWDSRSGCLAGSTFHAPRLPGWVQRLNDARIADRYFHQEWTRLLPAGLYGPRFLKAPGRNTGASRRHPNVFPKKLGANSTAPDRRYYSDLFTSPFGNDLVFEVARELVTAEALGKDDHTDLLCVSLSSNDVVGHAYGPDSDEVMDCTLRTDRQLAEFFGWLDTHVGTGRYITALSSDHGVGPLPEYARDLGWAAGRLDAGRMRAAINRALVDELGEARTVKRPVRDLSFPWLYLDEPVLREAGLNVADVARSAARIAEQLDGIARAIVVSELPPARAANPRSGGARTARRDLEHLVANSCYPGRSGHVYLHWGHYWYKGKKQAGHGSAYDYDRHVPVLIHGPQIPAGRFGRPVSPTGLVPTLCARLGIPNPVGATGEVYPEVAGAFARD
jgi:hypothetical protein